MNDISDNIYLKRRYTALSDFTLYDYLFNDIELERKANCDEAQVAISKLLATHGFKINLLGFKFLVALITRYIVNSDYNENKE
ncbi:MAG: hypothetical protein K2L54_04980, partial [Clostridiales bacterium]|nr:hypothetical protein [Clostridiales bacterium]